MYKVIKRMEVAGSHCLSLPYESKCKNIHGHNWIITVEVSAKELNKEGMVIDFVHIKEIVMQLDHQNINNHIDINPTAENLAHVIALRIQMRIDNDQPDNISREVFVTKVSVQESEGNTAIWTKD